MDASEIPFPAPQISRAVGNPRTSIETPRRNKGFQTADLSCYHRQVHFGLLIAVLVIIALFLAGGVFRYLRQECQEPRDTHRSKGRK